MTDPDPDLKERLIMSIASLEELRGYEEEARRYGMPPLREVIAIERRRRELEARR